MVQAQVCMCVCVHGCVCVCVCVCVSVCLCLCAELFLVGRFFPAGFFTLFFSLGDVGRHPPKLCHYSPQLSYICDVLCCWCWTR